MVNNNFAYYLGFSHCLGIGPMKFAALCNHFKEIKKAYNAKQNELEEVLGEKLAQKFVEFRNRFDYLKKIDEIRNKQITVLTREDKLYPPQLLNISDAPICLYVKGDLNKFNFDQSKGDLFFAIVGTRNPTFYGEQVAKKFATDLTQAGFVIVSGMALGIDAISHRYAMEMNGRTIAFLGCGVDICYPGANYKLYEKIIKGGGLVISEFPPGQTVLRGLFVARNRLISGLSKGVLVVEGTKGSGSLITARYAANQGKDVFAPPAPLTSIYSEAPNLLLKQGAKMVTDISDILEEFNLRYLPKKTSEVLKSLNQEEKNIFEELTGEPKPADELGIILKLPINRILNILSTLEIKGVVRKNKEGKYEVNL